MLAFPTQLQHMVVGLATESENKGGPETQTCSLCYILAVLALLHRDWAKVKPLQKVTGYISYGPILRHIFDHRKLFPFAQLQSRYGICNGSHFWEQIEPENNGHADMLNLRMSP